MKLLTVTVPCYNSAEYMEKCVDSLLRGGDRVEVIIINDGSKDNTGAIADAYVEKYPDIVRVIHQENGGHGEGINQGVIHATGKYFKVVDSDDVMSEDFLAFLDKLEECEKKGGIDLMVTNYYYVHTDGIGDRSINYKNALPADRIFGWEDTKGFRLHQLLTIHSCTFRTELMKRAGEKEPLPKHVFYEDNLMVYRVLQYVEKMCYMDIDLYRYWIGRPDQSMQEKTMLKRYSHHVLVAEKCFSAYHFDDIKEPKKKKYLKHEMFMIFSFAIIYTRKNKTKEHDADLKKMWETCMAFDEKWTKHFRQGTVLAFLLMPGRFGQNFCGFISWLANKVVRFN